MREILRMLSWLALANLPLQARAIDSCSRCVLGIWDDPGLSSNIGAIVAGQPKDVYVGIKFAEGFDETIGVSFSIGGLSPVLVLGVEPIVAPAVIICDDVAAPADTSQIGGCTFFWPSCLVGDQALLRLTLLTSSNVTNELLQVKRQYPVPHPDARTPILYQCDDPQYTPTRVEGGYYILNWDGDPRVRVQDSTWSTVKRLYR